MMGIDDLLKLSTALAVVEEVIHQRLGYIYITKTQQPESL
jgi:hypothetical protein